MKRKRLFSIMLLAVILCCSACQGEKEKSSTQPVAGLDKLGEIQVISREEGSGTRSTFAGLVGFLQKEQSKDSPDMTRSDAVVVQDAQSVVDAVKKEDAAIGYVSVGSVKEGEGLKRLCVNGFLPGQGDEKYPLSRSFYLAWNGRLSELEQDFLTYIHGAGQKIVDKSYISIAKSSSFLSNQAKGSIYLEGSTSVAPLVEELAENYMQCNPNARIVVRATDSTEGLNQVMAGKCDMGMSSRELKDYEKELLDYETIARDEIAVVVNQNNPLQDISLTDLKGIYTGSVGKWSELH